MGWWKMRFFAVLILAFLSGCMSTKEIQITAESDIPAAIEINSVVKCDRTPCHFSVACTHKKKIFGSTHYAPSKYLVQATALEPQKGFLKHEEKILDACQIGQDDFAKVRFLMREEK